MLDLERRVLTSPTYYLDDQIHLHYGGAGRGVLIPCEEREDDGLKIGVVGNRSLKPKAFLLVEKDRQPIIVSGSDGGEERVLVSPGKSAFVVLENVVQKRHVNVAVTDVLSGNPDRRDHVHCARVSDIVDAGWRVYWAPLQMRCVLLHARLVFGDGGCDPTIDDAQRLRDVFNLAC